jgi:hypothetical protein
MPRTLLARISERLKPAGYHALPLTILSILHMAVVERNLRGRAGMPVNMIPYDFYDSYSRYLVFISDSLRAGSWPIWFPYGHVGTPFLVNPQSQLWNPLTWILSIVPGYTLLVAQWQEMLIILFGSFGAYFLAHALWQKRWAALVTAIAYNFTSARLCNAEHLDIITAFSLFPWIFWCTKRVVDAKPWAVPLLGVFLGLLIVAGYPGVVILSPLWFGAWAVWLLVNDCNDRACRKKVLLRLGASGALALAISSGYWLPIATNMSAFNRGTPLGTDAALLQSLSLFDLWHLVYGTSVSLASPGASADPAMRGLYFGIVALLLALYAIIAARSRTVTALAVAFFAALLMSVGKHFFARVALQDYLSFLNMSRFPAVDSRAVAALAGSLMAGAGAAHLFENPDERRGLVRVLAGGIALLLIGLLWLGPAIHPGTTPAVLHEKFNTVVLFELFLVLFTLLAVLRFARPGALVACLLVLSAVDSGTQAFNQSFLWSVPGGGRVQQYHDIRKTDFNPAAALVPRVDAPALVDVRSNDGHLNKGFYLGSYSPFWLKRLEVLLANNFKGFLVNGKRIVGFTDEVPSEGGAFQQKATPVSFEIKRYLPDRVDYTVDLPARTELVFNEVYFGGWRARIDGGAAVPMHQVAGGLRALTVEAGHHTIATKFSPSIFWIGLVSTLLSWAFALAWLLGSLRKAGRQERSTPAELPTGTAAGAPA